MANYLMSMSKTRSLIVEYKVCTSKCNYVGLFTVTMVKKRIDLYDWTEAEKQKNKINRPLSEKAINQIKWNSRWSENIRKCKQMRHDNLSGILWKKTTGTTGFWLTIPDGTTGIAGRWWNSSRGVSGPMVELQQWIAGFLHIAMPSVLWWILRGWTTIHHHLITLKTHLNNRTVTQ